MNRKDLIFKYAGILRKRNQTTQKVRFLSELQHDLQKLGYETKVQASISGKSKYYNLYTTNLDQAKTVFSAYYDTPIKSLHLYGYDPLDPGSNKAMKVLSAVLPSLTLLFLLMGLIAFVFLNQWTNGDISVLDVIYALVSLGLFILVIRYRKGIVNGYNSVRNTNSILAFLELAAALSPSQKKRVAFAFTDFGALNGLGTEDLVRTLNKSNRAARLVLADCLASSEPVVVSMKGEWPRNNDALKPLNSVSPYLSGLDYPNLLLLATRPAGGSLKRVNTARDIECNDNQLTQCIDYLKSLI